MFELETPEEISRMLKEELNISKYSSTILLVQTHPLKRIFLTRTAYLGERS